MSYRTPYFSAYCSCGASLVEVLVSLVIFGISTLGLMNMQQRALHYTESAYWQGQALSLARQWVERISLDPAANNESFISAQAKKILPSPQLQTTTCCVHIAWLNEDATTCTAHCVSLAFAP